MKIISINVNGIRAAARKGMFDWLKTVDADVICLQELKAQPDQIEGEPYHPEGYHTYFHSAEKKGYSGVGVYCKQKPDAVHIGFGEASNSLGLEGDRSNVDNEGRYLQIHFPLVILFPLHCFQWLYVSLLIYFFHKIALSHLVTISKKELHSYNFLYYF